jgi:hypothetical protein
VTVYRPELYAPGMIRPDAAALGTGAGELLIPSDPTIAAIGMVSHITETSPVPTVGQAPRQWRREPGRTAHPPGRRRAGRPRRRPRPDGDARTAAMSSRHRCLGRTQDMPCQPPPRPLSALASALSAPASALSVPASALTAAGVVLAVAGCSHVTPLGPGPAPVSLPPPRDRGSPITMQIMRSQPPANRQSRAPVDHRTVQGPHHPGRREYRPRRRRARPGGHPGRG